MTADQKPGIPGATPDGAALNAATIFTPEQIVEAREKKILAGQVILIVGAGRYGIGGAIAREAALQGAHIVTSSRKKEDNSDALGLLEDLPGRGQAEWIPQDITSEDAGKFLVRRTVENFKRLDGVIIATGLRKDVPLFLLSEKSLREVFEVNYFGPLRLMKEAVGYWRKQEPPKGRITVISSLASGGSPMQIAYGSSKAALENAVKALAGEMEIWKSRQADLDISVNAVSPGLVTTPFVADVPPDQRELLLKMTEADRELQPEEVAELAVYLTSPFAEGISGKVIPLVGKGPDPITT